MHTALASQPGRRYRRTGVRRVVPRIVPCLVLGVALLGPWDATAAQDVIRRVHTYASGASGIFVNAYLVDTAHGVVAVDATLSTSDSRALRAKLDKHSCTRA